MNKANIELLGAKYFLQELVETKTEQKEQLYPIKR